VARSQILAATLEAQVSGYPVYDRKLLESELLERRTHDADWRCGSPYESIQRTRSKSSTIRRTFSGSSDNKRMQTFIKMARGWSAKSVLTEFESEMLARAIKSKTFGRSCTVLTF
jgi:hypothetical protein